MVYWTDAIEWIRRKKGGVRSHSIVEIHKSLYCKSLMDDIPGRIREWKRKVTGTKVTGEKEAVL